MGWTQTLTSTQLFPCSVWKSTQMYSKRAVGSGQTCQDHSTSPRQSDYSNTTGGLRVCVRIKPKKAIQACGPD